MNEFQTPNPSGTSADIAMTDRIIRLPTVISRTGLSRSSIYRAMASGSFPSSYRLPPTGYAVGWSEREINSFLDRLQPKELRSAKSLTEEE